MLLMHNDPLRRKLYGRAGRFRVKPYGLEYRTLDNYWLGTGDVDLYYSMFEVIKNTMSVDPNHQAWSILNEAHSDMCEAINEGDVNKVSDLMDSNPFYQLDYKQGRRAKEIISVDYTEGVGFPPSHSWFNPTVGTATASTETIPGQVLHYTNTMVEEESQDEN